MVGGVEDDAGVVGAGGELGEMGAGGAEDDGAVGCGDPEVAGGVECGEEAGGAAGVGRGRGVGVPLERNLETVEALTGPKLTTQALSEESMATE